MDSGNLITAQISFLDGQYSLIHIPIEFYAIFLQPILRLLFEEGHDPDASAISWTNRHDFMNITLTPLECSVICTKELSKRLFYPFIRLFESQSALVGARSNVEIGSDDYCVIQVDGEGLDAGQRVLELTSPLALAGISIFFVTTYFCDYILVPLKSKQTVMTTLRQQGFVFSHSADAFVSQLSPSSPTAHDRSCARLPSPSMERSAPTTPPARDLPELQVRTFNKLKQKQIRPSVDRTIRLVSCAGSRGFSAESDDKLKSDLLQVMLATSPGNMAVKTDNDPEARPAVGLGLRMLSDDDHDQPSDFSTRFLSLTIAAQEPISIFLEHKLLDRLGNSLLGAKSFEDTYIPITLDLRKLPMNATGIVCGIAGSIAQGVNLVCRKLGEVSPRAIPAAAEYEEQIEITFLSTAKAGAVLVRADQLDQALAALESVMQEADIRDNQ